MTKEQINNIFKEIKEKANLDFAYSEALDDCSTCTWWEIANKHGKDSKGIWLKHFTFGVNKGEWNTECNFIAHDLTKKQKNIVKNELEKHFIVEWDLSDSQCILIKNK